MKSEVLANFDMTWLTVLALVLFVSVFAGVVFWTFRKGSKEIYSSLDKIPFEKGAHHE